MTKLPLRYVNEYVDRTGKVRRYFRRNGKRLGRLPGDVWSEEFMAAYQSFLGAAGNTPKVSPAAEGSLGRLITAYYGSREFADLKPSSRQTYRYALEPIAAKYGRGSVAALTHRHASKLIAEIGARRPAMANLTKSVLQKLMKFAVREGWRDDNPMIGIEHYKGGEHHCWTEAELRTYEKRWPVGTRERLAYALPLHTCQRVGDVARMVRADITPDRLLHVVQEKTGVELWLPIVPELEQAMRAYPARGLSLIGRVDGRPISERHLSDLIGKAAKQAGLPAKCVAHGLRKAKMRRLAEAGATEKEIAAWSGHKTMAQVAHYTKAADQKRLAQAAADKMRTKVTN
jgi:integrase